MGGETLAFVLPLRHGFRGEGFFFLKRKEVIGGFFSHFFFSSFTTFPFWVF